MAKVDWGMLEPENQNSNLQNSKVDWGFVDQQQEQALVEGDSFWKPKNDTWIPDFIEGPMEKIAQPISDWASKNFGSGKVGPSGVDEELLRNLAGGMPEFATKMAGGTAEFAFGKPLGLIEGFSSVPVKPKGQEELLQSIWAKWGIDPRIAPPGFLGAVDLRRGIETRDRTPEERAKTIDEVTSGVAEALVPTYESVAPYETKTAELMMKPVNAVMSLLPGHYIEDAWAKIGRRDIGQALGYGADVITFKLLHSKGNEFKQGKTYSKIAEGWRKIFDPKEKKPAEKAEEFRENLDKGDFDADISNLMDEFSDPNAMGTLGPDGIKLSRAFQSMDPNFKLEAVKDIIRKSLDVKEGKPVDPSSLPKMFLGRDRVTTDSGQAIRNVELGRAREGAEFLSGREQQTFGRPDERLRMAYEEALGRREVKNETEATRPEETPITEPTRPVEPEPVRTRQEVGQESLPEVERVIEAGERKLAEETGREFEEALGSGEPVEPTGRVGVRERLSEYPEEMQNYLENLYRLAEEDGLLDVVRDNPKLTAKKLRDYIKENDDPKLRFDVLPEEASVLSALVDHVEELGRNRKSYLDKWVESESTQGGKPIERLKPEEVAAWSEIMQGMQERAKGTDVSGITQLYSGIPLDKIPETVKKWIGLRGLDPEKAFRNKKLWKETGFWLGRDGKWRYEISPSKFEFDLKKLKDIQRREKRNAKLEEVLKYPQLYEALPELRNTNVKFTDEIPYYDKPTDTIGLPLRGTEMDYVRTLSHELQHNINRRVGAFGGTSIENESGSVIANRLDKLLPKIKDKEFADEIKAGISNAGSSRLFVDPEFALKELIPWMEGNKNQLGLSKSDINLLKFPTGAESIYLRNPGEMEARLFEHRMSISDEAIRKIPPWETLDKMTKAEKAGANPTMLYSGIPLDKFMDILSPKLREFGKLLKADPNTFGVNFGNVEMVRKLEELAKSRGMKFEDLVKMSGRMKDSEKLKLINAYRKEFGKVDAKVSRAAVKKAAENVAEETQKIRETEQKKKFTFNEGEIGKVWEKEVEVNGQKITLKSPIVEAGTIRNIMKAKDPSYFSLRKTLGAKQRNTPKFMEKAVRGKTATSHLETRIHTMDRLGDFGFEVWRKGVSAENKEIRMNKADELELRKIRNDLQKGAVETKIRTLSGEEATTIYGKKNRMDPRTGKILSRNYNRKQLGKYAAAAQERGVTILTALGFKDIPTKFEHLSKSAQQAYTKLREFYKRKLTEWNESLINSGHEPIPEVENYATFFTNAELMRQMGSDVMMEFNNGKLTKDIPNMVSPKMMHSRFENMRKKGAIPALDIDPFRAARNYMQSVNRSINWTPVISWIKETQEFRDPNTGKIWKMEDQRSGVKKALDKLVNDITGVTDMTAPMAEYMEYIDGLRSNIANYHLSGNPRTAEIQPLALINTVFAVGPINTLKGGFKSIGDLAKALKKNGMPEAINKSEVLFKTWHGSVGGELLDLTAGSFYTIPNASRLAKIWAGTKGIYRVAKIVPSQVLNILIKSSDFASRNITWHAAVSEAKTMRKKGKLNWSDERIHQYADDIVERTQVGPTKLSRSPIQQHALGRFVTNMGTFVIGNWNFIAKDILELHGKAPEITRLNNRQMRRVLKFGSLMTTLSMVGWFFEDVLGQSSPVGNPVGEIKRQWSEDDWNYIKILGEFMELTSIPLLTNARFDSSLLGAGWDFVENVVDKGFERYTYERWYELLGTALGQPAGSTTNKVIRAEEKGEDPLKAALRIKQ